MCAQNSLKIFILYIHTWIILCFDKKLKSHIPEQFSPSARYFDDKVIFSTCLPPFHHILFGWRCASTSSSSWPQKTMWGNNLMRWRSHEVTILQCWTWWARTARSFSSPSYSTVYQWRRRGSACTWRATVVAVVRHPCCHSCCCCCSVCSCAIAWHKQQPCSRPAHPHHIVHVLLQATLSELSSYPSNTCGGQSWLFFILHGCQVLDRFEQSTILARSKLFGDHHSLSVV